ncbi:MAG: MBOAT family protein [Clostridia bacterium]|nr:MBOAT family protein [Clostridia bacterium]
MVFSEPVFMFLFLPVSLLVYYAVPFRFKNAVLFFTGLLFYSWGEPVYVLIMVLSTLIDYLAGRTMDRFDSNNRIRKIALVISVIMNLSLLGVFKYSGFLIDSVNSLFNLSLYNPDLPLPIGISFFTFQSMSYTIDLYRRKITVQKSFIKFAAFVTMFPQIVAGPIVLYDDIAKELEERKINFEAVSNGISIFICGLCKKVLIANSVGELWTSVKDSDYSSLPAATAWLGIIAFTLQIYFDFSGYSDMAVGLGKMLGFNFPKNFDYPYNSKTVSDFWRRWHMTLGGWFKNYVYFPLGGSRNGKVKTIRNLLIVWFLTGMWHGASWNFIIWGVYYGILLILEKFVFASVIKRLPTVITRIYTLLAVVFGWIIFEIYSPALMLSFIGSMFGTSGILYDSFTLNAIHNYSLTLIIAAITSSGLPLRIWKKISSGRKSDGLCIAGEAIGMAASIAYLVDASYNPFLYFNF